MTTRTGKPSLRDRLDVVLKAARHPLRIVVGLLAVLGLVAGFAGGSGIAAAVVGALVGWAAGELLGRWKRLRLPALAVALVGVVLVASLVSRFVVGWAIVPALVGAAIALHLKTMLVLGSLSFAATSMLRTAAVRRPSWRFVEIGVFSMCFVAAFAAHRDGSIARPLWLSDWAWRAGYDPGNVLLMLGAGFGVLCAALLLMESKHRLSALALGVLPLLAIVLLSVVDPQDLAPDPGVSELEEIQGALQGGEQVQDVDIPITIGTGDDPLPTEDGGPARSEEDGGDGTADAQPNPGEGEGEGAAPDVGGEEQGDGQDEGEGQEDGGAGEEGESESGEEGGEQEQPEGGEEGEGEQPQGSEQGDGEEASGEEGQDPNGGEQGGEPEQPSGGEGEGQSESPEQPQQGEGDGQGEGEGGPPPDDLQQAEQPEMSFENSSQQGGASIAAVVVFLDDYRTPSGYYYFRQKVMSEFGQYRFEETTREDADLDVYPEFPTRVDRVDDPPPWQARTRVRARVAMVGQHDTPFALESPVLYLPSTNPNPDRFHTVYRFESMAQETPYEELVGREARGPEWSDELLDYYLTAPADERYAELVDEILADIPQDKRDDPFIRALAIKVHLDERMAYSLDARYPGWDDATAGFLFAEEDRYVGYCVHAAHAAVYMWRLAGVPARIGTGYLVDESARRGSSLLVMGGDAHAWPELYLDGVGWIPMDISAAEDLSPPGNPVDSDVTQVLGEMVADAEDITDEQAKPFPFAMWLRRILVVGVVLLALTGLMSHYLVKGWRRARPFMARPKTIPRVAYRACLDRLAEAGLVRDEGETREAFARRIALDVPAFVDITDMHVGAAFSRPETPSPEQAKKTARTWAVALDALTDQLQERVPVWRRVLGALDPTSLYRAR